MFQLPPIDTPEPVVTVTTLVVLFAKVSVTVVDVLEELAASDVDVASAWAEATTVS